VSGGQQKRGETRGTWTLTSNEGTPYLLIRVVKGGKEIGKSLGGKRTRRLSNNGRISKNFEEAGRTRKKKSSWSRSRPGGGQREESVTGSLTDPILGARENSRWGWATP